MWNKKDSNFFCSVICAPTPNAELAKLIQAREKELNKNSRLSIKVIEKGGTKLNLDMRQNTQMAQNFSSKQLKSFFDALSRQADEAVRINNFNSAKIINNKLEFNSAPIGQLKVIKSEFSKSVHFVTEQSNPKAQAIQVSSTDEASIGGEN